MVSRWGFWDGSDVVNLYFGYFQSNINSKIGNIIALPHLYTVSYFKVQVMQIQKSIQIFLQKNNLHATLQQFKNQSKRSSVHYGPNKISQLAHIHKFILTAANEVEVREHFQKTDGNTLRKAVRRLKRKPKVPAIQSNVTSLTKMKFFKKLLQKQNQNSSNILEQPIGAQLRESRAFSNALEESRQYENEWQQNNQIGYEVYECNWENLAQCSQQIGSHKGSQQSAIKHVEFPEAYYQAHSDKITKVVQNARDKKKSRLPPKTLFKHEDGEDIYPLENGDTTYDSYDLKIIYDRQKTGFEQERQLPIVINQVLAARYQVVAVLGQAQFSKAIQVVDLQNNKNYCIKIIQNSKQENSKNYFDQSIDEIKLLRFISANCNPDQCHLLVLHDFFYHKEHLMLVTQLLKDNLYDAYKMHPKHFDLPALQIYTKQILKALDKLHSLHIIHTDLKPQNILIKSYSKFQLKVIDIGSSLFFHDKLSFYVQTISYRAPEVILGCPYDEKIDVWSLGCIVAELYTGEVLFDSSSVGGMLAKIQGLRGPWPSWMIEKGKYSKKYFTKDLIPYQQIEQEPLTHNPRHNSTSDDKICRLFYPKLTNLRSRLNCQDKLFIDFLSKCLKIDPSTRISVKEALKHPFLNP